MRDRRKFLVTLGTVGTITIAGCAGSDDDPEDEVQESEKYTNTEQETSELTGPEAVVGEFFTAIKNDNMDVIDDVLHSESNLRPINNVEFFNRGWVLTDLEEVSTRVLVERRLETFGWDWTEDEIEEQVNEIDEVWQSAIADSEADDYAFVHTTVQIEGETNELPMQCVHESENWYVESPTSFIG